MINFDLIQTALPHLLRGTIITLEITFLSLLIGFIGGTILAIIQTSGPRFLYYAVEMYATLIRGTPMLIQIFFLNFVLLPALHLPISVFWGAVIAIGLNSSAYVSQIVRSGIKSVSAGQIEAAKTLGIKQGDIMRFIILPQAIRIILPALGNESITLIKDSSLASLIGVMELYNEGRVVISQTYDSLTIFAAMAAIYLFLTCTISFILTRIEKRLQWHTAD